jgi:beta-lactamase class A
VCGLDGAVRRAQEPDAVHYAASTMKLPLLAAAYLAADRGDLDIESEVLVHNRFASAADGSPFSLDQGDDQDDDTWDRIGTMVSLRRLVEHCVVRSGNLATNLVLEVVGLPRVRDVLERSGCTPSTVVSRGIEDAAARRAGRDNLVTAADLARVMTAIASRSLGPVCAEVEEVLSRQEHRDAIPAGLPPGTYVANKTGWVPGVSHDVAVVRPDDAPPYVLAVCTTLDLSEEAADELIASVSSTAWQSRHQEQERDR